MRAHYGRLQAELWAQFETLRAFVSVEFTPVDPYKNSAEMFRSISEFRTLFVYTGGNPLAGHPMASIAPNGQSWNNVFRAVHDGFAHFPDRNNFSMTGELRAFRAHCDLLSPDARLALATETIGQNLTYHLGSNPKTFPPQKALILPADLVETVYRSLEY
jgi:hypothetical protein